VQNNFFCENREKKSVYFSRSHLITTTKKEKRKKEKENENENIKITIKIE